MTFNMYQQFLICQSLMLRQQTAQLLTLFLLLDISLDITLKLNVEYAVLVFDELIYAKAQHVRWKNET